VVGTVFVVVAVVEVVVVDEMVLIVVVVGDNVLYVTSFYIGTCLLSSFSTNILFGGICRFPVGFLGICLFGLCGFTRLCDLRGLCIGLLTYPCIGFYSNSFYSFTGYSATHYS